MSYEDWELAFIQTVWSMGYDLGYFVPITFTQSCYEVGKSPEEAVHEYVKLENPARLVV
jgi:hypothetical protein